MSNLPSFLVIGAQKAGTSWLWVQLKKHPDIWMPPIKELHYFDYLFLPEIQRWAKQHIRNGTYTALKWHALNHNAANIDYSYTEYLSKLANDAIFTEQWYKDAFDRPAAKKKLKGDITPEYSMIPLEGIEYVKGLLGKNVKIIYIIRDPVDRVLSQLRMGIQRRNIDLNDLNKNSWLDLPDADALLTRGDYKTYVPNWDNSFSKDKILYIPYSKLKLKPAEVISDVESFLEIPHFNNYVNLTDKVHETKKIDIPNYVKDRFFKLFEDQYDFLYKRFGSDFH